MGAYGAFHSISLSQVIMYWDYATISIHVEVHPLQWCVMFHCSIICLTSALLVGT